VVANLVRRYDDDFAAFRVIDSDKLERDLSKKPL
jgi:hypothetical protein